MAQAQAQAQAPTHEAPAGGRLLILQLGATNDASGAPDPDVLARCPVTVALHRAAVAAGRLVTVRSRQTLRRTPRVSSVRHCHIPISQEAHAPRSSLTLAGQGTAGISFNRGWLHAYPSAAKHVRGVGGGNGHATSGPN